MNGFNAARLVATIQLDGVQQVASGLDRVRSDLTNTDRRFDGTRKAAAAAFTGAAAAAGVATAGTAILLAKVVSTGAAYNALQQTSRAALASVLGGAEAANAQMDKLDAFARESPFAKDVFVKAQQQMLAFGFATEDVIPTLDAVQNAIAATGGSGQQLSEVVFVLSQIRAAGKITGTDLMQLGQRGIDAAGLIGDSMGKTGAEIRTMITKNKLDVNDALDAITSGMAKSFEGASAGVKRTIQGTVDRVRAASRDIGAALAEPFVSQQGGGLAVEWGNQFADVLRAIERQVPSVVGLLMTRMTPAIAGVTGGLDGAAASVDRWDASKLEDTLNFIEANAPAVGALAGALLAANSQMLAGVPIVGKLVPAFSPLLGIIGGLVATSPELRASLGDLFRTTEPLVPLVGDLGRTISGGLNAVLPVTASVIRTAADAARPLLELLGSIPTPVLAGAAAFLIMQQAAGPLGRGIELLSAGTSILSQNMAASRGVNEAMGRSTGFMSTAMMTARVAVDGVGTSLKAAFISNPVGLALLVLSAGAAALSAAFAANAEKAQKLEDRAASLRDTLHEVTGAYTAATQAAVANNLVEDGTAEKLDAVGLSVTNYTDAILGSDVALTRFAENQSRIAQGELSATARNDAEALAGLGLTLDDLVQSYFGVEGAREKVNAALDGTVGYEQHLQNFEGQLSQTSVAGENFMGNLYDQREALASAQEQQRLYNEAVRQSREEMSEAALSNERLNTAMEIARDTTRDATERLNALKQALDELNGGSQTAAEQQRALAERTLSLGDAFQVLDENGKNVAATLVDGTGSIDLSTRAGLNLEQSIASLNDQMLTNITQASDLAKKNGETGLSMEEAARQGQPFIDALRDQAEQAGLSGEQIDALIEKQLAIPEVTAWLLSDGGSIDETSQKIGELAIQIDATPDKTITIDEPLSAAVKTRLEQLGYTITTLPDGKVQITSAGQDLVEATLRELTKDRTAKITFSSVFQPGAGAGGVPYANPDINKDGNLYAGGQKITAFANGGFPSGVYAGQYGGIHKFAEKESGVPWELYLSGRPSAKAQNQRLMERVAPMLGMEVVRAGANPKPATVASDGPGQGSERAAAPSGRTAPYIGNVTFPSGDRRSSAMMGDLEMLLRSFEGGGNA